MATQGERIVALETKMNHLVHMIEEHRQEARVYAAEAKVDRDALKKEVSTLSTLATESRGGFKALMWVAGFSGSLGAALVYVVKNLSGALPRL